MAHNDYYLGLSFEPTAIGWAVTDTHYKILRAHGKDLWGVHEFEKAKTAEDRRLSRASRRRTERTRARIGLLRTYFSDAVAAVDPDFFTRLDNSKYYVEDKDANVQYPHIFFHDPNYTDADYHRDYPTIFHLRAKLLDMDQTGKAFDVRLVYLALANMFKHRGNFYMSVSKNSDTFDLTQQQMQWEELCSNIYNICGISLSMVSVDEIVDILADTTVNKRAKTDALLQLLHAEKKDKAAYAFIKCLCGMKIDASVLFNHPADEAITIYFSSASYDDTVPELEERLGAECYEIIEQMKSIYDFSIFQSILQGKQYLSLAQVESYEKHARDLKLLKSLYRKYLPGDLYTKMFCSDLPGTYSAYVNSMCQAGKRKRRGIGGSRSNAADMQQNMYRTIKKDLALCPQEDDLVSHVLSEMDCGKFLMKQRTNENSVIPNQIYAYEMRRILDCACNYLPFLNERDSSGYTVADRILYLFTFCMPYYIGPLGSDSKTGWVVRRPDFLHERILPWNLDKAVDIKATTEQFINHLIRSCTYISGEKVLPKHSLLYERFSVLNTINTICIDGERLSTHLKQRVYLDLFVSGKPVTKKKLCTYLVAAGAATSADQISGVADVIDCTLSSYQKLKPILGEWIDTEDGAEVAEQIVYWGTVFGDSRQMFLEHLRGYVSEGRLSDAQVQQLSVLRFKDWGRVSSQFLHLRGMKKPADNQPAAIELSLIDALWSYSLNLMELINSDGFTFRYELEHKRMVACNSLTDFQYEDLDEFRFSAPVKRMVWRTILVTREIVDVMGHAPTRLFLEMARTSESSADRQNISLDQKKAYLLRAYDKIADTDTHKWKVEIEAAAESGILNRRLVYLYYCQMGYDLYTGKEIPLEDVIGVTSNTYNIDHIYPKHFVIDTNMDNNLVLVNAHANEVLKSDRYPVPMEIWDNSDVRRVWDMLHRNGLMNDEKYRRLTSRTPFSNQQMGNFIAAQMVETSQGGKGIAALLKDLLPNSTDVVFAKGSNVAGFRQKFELPRLRVLNELHHAQEAYLNIVVGNVFYTKFTRDPWQFIRTDYARDHRKYHYNLSRMFDRDVIRDDAVAWKSVAHGSDATIEVVRAMFQKTSALLTRMPFESHGALSKATIYSADKAKPSCYYPVKTSDTHLQDVKKYGGVTAISIAYFFLISYYQKGKCVLRLESLPMIFKPMVENSEDGLKHYCEDQLGYERVKVIFPKIRIHSTLEINGYRVYLSGRSGSSIILRNAEQMFLSDEQSAYVKHIEKHAPLLTALYKRNPKELDMINLRNNVLTSADNLILYDALTKKHTDTMFAKRPSAIGQKLTNARSRFLLLSVPAQCLVLYQMLLLSRIGISVGDLSLVGDVAHAGIMRINSNLDYENNKIYLISQSVTGLKETRKRIVPDM